MNNAVRRQNNNEHLALVEKKRLEARDVLIHLTVREVGGLDNDIDFDFDWRWGSVTAMTTIDRDGKSYRVSVEEVEGQ